MKLKSKECRFRSNLERRIASEINNKGVDHNYEEFTLKYVQPSKNRSYTPDFMLSKKDGSVIYIEAKGRLYPQDRFKHLWVKEQHPGLDIRFVFSNAANKIIKGSKTTYSKWCNVNGFKWAQGSIPDSWYKE